MKLYSRLTCRCLVAVGIGIAIVSVTMVFKRKIWRTTSAARHETKSGREAKAVSEGQGKAGGAKCKSKYTHPFFVELDEDNDFVYVQLPVDDRETMVYNGMTKKEYDILEMDYLRYIVTQQYDCRERVRAGNIDEGGWEVCLDPPFNIKRNQCLVYSFGIKNDWSFDDFMVEKGCEVHSFDPTIGREDYQRHTHNYFHNLGLDGIDGLKLIKKQNVSVKKLSSIMDILGHTKKTIDFLKFDIEMSEWSAIKTMIEDRSILKVKQMAAELHTPFNSRVIPTMEQMQLIKDLKNTGFKIFFSSYQFSPFCRRFSPQTKRLAHAFINIHFVNTNFLKERQ
ncbi:methyltransferase-like protein 24 [Lingula anatina]|uniref:Methyltransferase-like protein 24 n=1 Tax=Lingula anatina TaxID=7574 RepID=A0A1S3H4T1_LINAN|nr:methyltransferase-like protein 24 [Lingula anatina]|eukprot:XP_013380977.1 methyltransferase-like protein 24 [Lingula anatina]